MYLDGVGCPCGSSVRGGSPLQFSAAGSEVGDAVALRFHGGAVDRGGGGGEGSDALRGNAAGIGH